MSSRDLHLELDLAVSAPDQTITGRLTTSEGDVRLFAGWLQLLSVLEATVDQALGEAPG